VKNYILVGHDGKKTFKGASVRSRADEPFGREFISQAVDLLLDDDKHGVSRLYKELMERITRKELPVAQFARRERITHKTFASSQRKRLATAAEGLRVGEYITVYERNDGTLGLIEEYDGDENTEHLLDKLYKFACRLREAFGDEFDDLFPNPAFGARARKAEAQGQQSLF
jgi:DNA polymerase I